MQRLIGRENSGDKLLDSKPLERWYELDHEGHVVNGGAANILGSITDMPHFKPFWIDSLCSVSDIFQPLLTSVLI